MVYSLFREPEIRFCFVQLVTEMVLLQNGAQITLRCLIEKGEG